MFNIVIFVWLVIPSLHDVQKKLVAVPCLCNASLKVLNTEICGVQHAALSLLLVHGTWKRMAIKG